MAAPRTTFDGVSLAEAKRIVDYEFGEHLIKIERNNKTQNYEVWIENKIKKEIVEKFKRYHKNNFKVKVYQLDYEM